MGELGALMADPPFTTLYKDKVTLCPHSHFLPRVSSEYHINQEIHLLVFYRKSHASKEETSLHMLGVRRDIAYYLDRTKIFRSSPGLFVSFAERVKGQP